MQTFLPFPDFAHSAEVLDYRRLGSQIHECSQILDALHETNNGGYRTHIVTRMWRGHELALCGFAFACEDEWEKRGYKRRAEVDNLVQHLSWASSGDVDMTKPSWFGDPAVHVGYQRLLLFKNFDHYSKHFPGVEPFADSSEFKYPDV